MEMDVGIICACLPYAKPCVRYFFPGLLALDSKLEQHLNSIKMSFRFNSPSRLGHREDTAGGTQVVVDTEQTETEVVRPPPGNTMDNVVESESLATRVTSRETK